MVLALKFYQIKPFKTGSAVAKDTTPARSSTRDTKMKEGESSDIEVGNGWWRIIADAIDEAAEFPDEWGFEFVGATRRSGALLLHAVYNPRDMQVGSKEQHPYDAFVALREKARMRLLHTCEVCGAAGSFRGLTVRCDEHFTL